MERPKLTETEKSKTDNIKGFVQKEFILAGQTINSAYYLAFYGDCIKCVKTSP
jgi:hypothetical protein